MPIGGFVLGDSVRRSGYLREWLILGIAIEAVHTNPLFGSAAPDYVFDPAPVGWFALIGIVAAAFGYAYAKVFYGTVALTQMLPFWGERNDGKGRGKVVKPAIGGLLVGLLIDRTDVSIYTSQRLNREAVDR
jgi:H+/Cl- antiporter ClcA